MADQASLVGQEVDLKADETVMQGEDRDMISGDHAEAQEDDMGELDFNYDDSLLQADGEEDVAATDTQQQEQEDQESERRKKEQNERNWGPYSAHALPVHKSDMPAQSRHSNDHADRQRNYTRPQRSYPSRESQPTRGRESLRGRSNFSHSREAMQDQGRRAEGARASSHPPALPVRRQQPAGSSAMSQYPRPAPPGRQSQTDQEFDPNILSSMVGFNPLELLGNAPSFAPDAAEPGHKRTHDQMQQMPQMPLLTPELIHSLQQIRQQQPQQHRHSQQQQAWPGAQPNGPHMPPHSMMGPAIPPPRPPQGPPPPGQPPHIPHSASLFGAPNFSVTTSQAMDGRPYQGGQVDPQGSRLRAGGPLGWSLSHGMDGAERPCSRQEPMLAADMVWDSDSGQGNISSQSAGTTRVDHFRNHMAGQRQGMPGPNSFIEGPRVARPRAPAPAQNKAAEAAKTTAALAAAKARFEQQQKENEAIAERNKRQRHGLPEPTPAMPETEIDRLRRQIAEKEAAKKAAQAQMPTVTKSAPPSPVKGRAASLSPSPSSLPEGSTPPSMSGKAPRIQSSVQRVQPSEPIDQNDRWRPNEEGQSVEKERERDRTPKSVVSDGRGQRSADDSSHHSSRHKDHRGASRESSRDRQHRDRRREDHHRSQRSGSMQRSDGVSNHAGIRPSERRDQHPGRRP